MMMGGTHGLNDGDDVHDGHDDYGPQGPHEPMSMNLNVDMGLNMTTNVGPRHECAADRGLHVLGHSQNGIRRRLSLARPILLSADWRRAGEDKVPGAVRLAPREYGHYSRTVTHGGTRVEWHQIKNGANF